MDNLITLLSDNGEEIKAKILFTYFSEEFNHNYVIFQVCKTNEISCSIYFPDDLNKANGHLEPVTDEDEWAMLEDVLNDWADENGIPEGCEGSCEACGGCNA